MGTDNLCDPARQEIPDNNPSVVATDCEESAALIERACDCHVDTVESAIKVLNEIYSDNWV